tara:strand:+ start:115 stop:651 length:537 start_codon:yes stop_codon:yes gene_type:complete
MKKLLLPSICSVVLLLGACSGVKEELGLTRNSPDEFTVVKRAPLTLPPEYNLRPPGSGPTAVTSGRTAGTARTAVFGSTGTTTQADNADSAFLAKAGAVDADSSIRNVIEQENGYITVENRSTIEKLLRRDGDAEAAVVVDPVKEKQRLDANASTGAPVNSGDVPVIEKKQSTIERLF